MVKYLSEEQVKTLKAWKATDENIQSIEDLLDKAIEIRDEEGRSYRKNTLLAGTIKLILDMPNTNISEILGVSKQTTQNGFKYITKIWDLINTKEPEIQPEELEKKEPRYEGEFQRQNGMMMD